MTTSTHAPAEQGPGAGLYVYGIVRADARLPEGLVGVLTGSPRLYPHGELAAVASELPDDADFGTPQDLVAHSAVLDAIAEVAAVLPMRFGTVLPTADTVGQELLTEPAGLLDALADLEGSVQYTLRVRYEQSEVLPEILRADPRLAQLQQEIAGTTEDETRSQRIMLGEGIVGHFDSLRETDAPQVLDAVEPLIRDRVLHEPGQADVVADLALLVEHGATDQLEAVIEETAERDHPRLRYRLLGPQAPYDFVEGGQ